MKSTSFKIIRIITGLLTTIQVIVTLVYAMYAIYYNRTISTEDSILNNTIVKLAITIKLTIFFNLLIALITAYSYNISSKALMKTSTYLILIALFVQGFILYQVKYSYTANYKASAKIALYNSRDFPLKAQQLFSDISAPQAAEMCINEMSRLANIFIYYNIMCMSIAIIEALLLTYTRKIKINKIVEVPEMTKIHRAGLNTESLRVKRVLIGTA